MGVLLLMQVTCDPTPLHGHGLVAMSTNQVIRELEPSVPPPHVG